MLCGGDGYWVLDDGDQDCVVVISIERCVMVLQVLCGCVECCRVYWCGVLLDHVG